MAAPGAGALRGGMRAARGAAAASEAGGVAEGLFRGTGLSRSRNIPYQYPASRPAIQALNKAPASPAITDPWKSPQGIRLSELTRKGTSEDITAAELAEAQALTKIVRNPGWIPSDARLSVQALDPDAVMPAFTSQGSRQSMGGVDEIPFRSSAPQAPGLPREQRAAFDEAIDLGEIGSPYRPSTRLGMRPRPKVSTDEIIARGNPALRYPMGQGSRPRTPEFARELESIDSLSEQDIAELMDAIAWSRR